MAILEGGSGQVEVIGRGERRGGGNRERGEKGGRGCTGGRGGGSRERGESDGGGPCKKIYINNKKDLIWV